MKLIPDVYAATPPPNTMQGIFGTITPVGPITGDPAQGLSNLLVFGLKAFLLIAALAVLMYLLWGAFDWITSGGDKEKVSKAQNKMTYAVLGIILIVVILAVFGVVAGDILGVMKKDVNGNWYFNLPVFGQ